MKYRIISKAGQDYGVYEAPDADSAFRAMLALTGDVPGGPAGIASDWIITEEYAVPGGTCTPTQ
jgi:hypothetical protein